MAGDFSPVDTFWNNVPREYMSSVFRRLVANYKIASERPFEEFDKPEASNIRPLWRRQLIEGDLRLCAEKFEGTVTAVAMRDIKETWWFHTLVTCGNVAFTQNAAQHPDELVRHSFFRARYAATNQLWLEGMGPDEATIQAEDGLPMYGVLLHGRDPAGYGQLGFAVVRFPNPELTGYYEGQIDIFREFPDIAAEIGAADKPDIQEEKIEDLPDIEFRDEDEEKA